MIVPMAGRGGAAPFSSINGPNHPLAPRAIWAISEKKNSGGGGFGVSRSIEEIACANSQG